MPDFSYRLDFVLGKLNENIPTQLLERTKGYKIVDNIAMQS